MFEYMHNRSVAGPERFVDYLNGSSNSRGSRGGNVLGHNVPVEYADLIHPHWRAFPAPEVYNHVFFFIVYCILLCSTLFGNGMVIWIFGTSKNLRTPSNLLIINLAVFDLTMAVDMPMFLYNTINGYFVGGQLACDIYAMFGGVSGMGGAMTNSFIAYDRFKTISNPIDGRMNSVQISLLILLSWLWTIPFSVLPFMRIWGRNVPEGYLTTCSFDYLTYDNETIYFGFAIFIWSYFIPMVMIWRNYAKLFFHVRAHEKMLADQAKKMNVKSLSAKDPDDTSVELKIAKAAITIFFLFVSAWTPYSIVALTSNFGYGHLVTPTVSMFPAMAAKIVSCIDPWVYAASHPKYRLELEKRFPWLGIQESKKRPPPSSSASNDNESRDTNVNNVSIEN